MSLVIEARNYHGLADIEWRIEQGLSVVVGANGAGKTTLLFLLDILRRASSRTGGLQPALSAYGTRALRYAGAGPRDTVRLGAKSRGAHWSFEVLPEGGGISAFPAERFSMDDRVVYERPLGRSTVTWEGKEVATDQRAILRMLADADLTGSFPGNALLDELARCRIYHDYKLHHVRQGGRDSSNTSLDRYGNNVFSVLRNWRDRQADRDRTEFVIESLRECFGFFGDLDFVKGGDIIEGEILPRRFPHQRIPVAQVANGWIVALLHFTAVAGADRGDVVGIDEFENALHPRALIQALDAIDDYANSAGISVVLTTQSPAVLDWFDARPERVLVLDRGLRPGPKPVTDLKTKEWLSHFRLGHVFAEGDFGTGTEG